MGDFDADGDVDLQDLASFTQCFGAGNALDATCFCANANGIDGDVNQADWTLLEADLTGPQ